MKNEILNHDITNKSAIEKDFPVLEVSKLSQRESWRKEINRPIYHIHKWWATRLGSVFRAINIGVLSNFDDCIWDNFYKIHAFKDKIIFDPFMGSGTTLGEAIKLGARTIGNDINPISTFIVRQSFADINKNDLFRYFNSIKDNVKDEIDYYYKTLDSENHLIPVLYYFWVKTVTLPDGNDIPLFSSYIFSRNASPQKNPKAQIICPKCWLIFESRYDSTDSLCPHCNYKFNPQKGTVSGQIITDSSGKTYKVKDLILSVNTPSNHKLYAKMALNTDNAKVYLPITDYDINLYKEASLKLQSTALPLPSSEVRPGINTDQARGYNYLFWRDFFNDRQLLCLGTLLSEILKIDDIPIQEQFLCLFSGTLEFNNMFCSFKGEGTGAVRHMFSNHILKPERTPIENSVWGTPQSSGTFSTLFESRLLPAKRYLAHPFDLKFGSTLFGESNETLKIIASNPLSPTLSESWKDFADNNKQMMILNGDSAQLDIPNNSVDAVVTDPPYFDFVNYSELSDFFYSWLSLALNNRYPWMSNQNCYNGAEVQHSDPLSFSIQLEKVFTECHRILKDNGTLCFSFHHSRPEGWAAIYRAVVNSMFMIVAVYPVHAELKVASPKSASKTPISLDSLLICKKISSDNLHHNIDLSKYLETYALQFNKIGISLSTADKFVMLASCFIANASLEKLSFEDIVKKLEFIKSEIT